uniref:Pectinesterase n=1 Tax=Oryza punctata TaxID=4537 RepID=A0A0E0M447_ORYPU
MDHGGCFSSKNTRQKSARQYRRAVKLAKNKQQIRTMIHSRKLAQLARKLQQRMIASSGGARHTAGTTGDCCSTASSSSLAGKGRCAVYTADGARFEVPLPYLGTPLIGELLTMSQEEFGFASDDGRITLPCDASVMEYVMCLLNREASEEVERAFLTSMARPCHYAGSQQSVVPAPRVPPLVNPARPPGRSLGKIAGGVGCDIDAHTLWHEIAMELKNAFSTSTEAFLLSKHITYSITMASHGNVIFPSLVKPNSSCDILRSSPKTIVPRYRNGTSNRMLSAWQDIGIEPTNAFTTSTEGFLLSKHMAYSISAASKGNMILPSLVKPNSSWDILRSSLKTAVPRYTNGTSNRLPSAVYMTQWPLTATEVEHSSVSRWQGATMELSNAFSTSAEAFLLSKHMAYAITAASQGNMILPSLVKPNSSWDILRSSLKTAVPRYANGTSNRLPSAVYMTQWPLPATDVQHSSFSLAFIVSLFLPSAAILCHFLATHDILHNPSITRQCDPSIGCEAKLLLRHPEELCEDRRGEERQRDLEPPPIGSVHDAMALHCHRTAAFIDIFRSSPKTDVPRYSNGTSNRVPSVVYTAQWPLPARDAVLQQLHMTYSITDASHGNVILPSSLAKPNSS